MRRRGPRYAACAALALIGGVEACTLLRPLHGLTCEPGAADASCFYGDPCDRDADCATTACRKGRCQCPDDMVTIESEFCIDATEVSNAAYRRFLASAPRVDQQAPYCLWNKDFGFDVTTGPDVCRTRQSGDSYPATCIDWCDAAAYCRRLGKHLCGRIQGGPSPYSAYKDASQSAWFAACSQGGALAFPTGDYDPRSCNGGSDGPVEISTSGRCEGGYNGLYDMSGNVREWEDACSGETGNADSCLTRGGAFDSAARGDTDFSALRCDVLDPRDRDDTDVTIGFRCCSG